MQGEYPIISSAMFSVDIRFIADNLLIATMFIVNGTTVIAYDQLLTNGPVRSINYLESGILGEYARLQIDSVGGAVTEQTTTITLFENGTATVSIYTNDGAVNTLVLSENGYYRITADGHIWFMNNGRLGVMEITDVLVMYVRTGQDYQSANGTGTWLAADNASYEFANILEITAEGKVLAYAGGNAYGTNYNIVSASEYAATLQTPNGIYRLEIELIENNLLRNCGNRPARRNNQNPQF
jgi:hypothetical protein